MTDIKQAQAAYSHDEYVKEVMADPLKAIAYLKHTYKENATTMACVLSVEKALQNLIAQQQGDNGAAYIEQAQAALGCIADGCVDLLGHELIAIKALKAYIEREQGWRTGEEYYHNGLKVFIVGENPFRSDMVYVMRRAHEFGGDSYFVLKSELTPTQNPQEGNDE